MKKLAVFNKKGGVGKSTISVQLAHGLAKKGSKVLLFDLDSQNNCSLYLGVKDTPKTFFDAIDERYPEPIENCIYEVRDNLFLLPNSKYDIIEKEIFQFPRVDYYLRDMLEGVNNYDYIIVDCPPTLSVINNAVLYYVDNIVVPVLLESGSIQAINDLHDYLTKLKLQPSMIKWIQPNKYRKTTNLHKEVLERLQETIGEKVLSPIYNRIKIADLTSKGKTAFEYDKGLQDMFKPLIRRVENG